MSNLVEALDALLDELTRLGSPLASHLKPGLPADQVVAAMTRSGGDVHPDVIALYSWHNGFNRFEVPTSPNGYVSLVPSHQEFNPLDDALEAFAQRRIAADRLASTPVRDVDGTWMRPDPESIWSHAWFPVFRGPGSEAIFITNANGVAGSVWLDPVQDVPQRLYDSLADAMDAVRQALIDGRLELDPQGVFTLESTTRTGWEF